MHQSSKRQWQALSYKDGCGAKKRETVIKSIFGHDGLIVLIRFFESKFADMDSVLVKFSKQLSETFETTTIRPCFTSSAKWYSEQALE